MSDIAGNRMEESRYCCVLCIDIHKSETTDMKHDKASQVEQRIDQLTRLGDKTEIGYLVVLACTVKGIECNSNQILGAGWSWTVLLESMQQARFKPLISHLIEVIPFYESVQ